MRHFLVPTLALLAAGLSAPAFAHAHLKAAVPAVDGTVAEAPTELDLSFSEALELKFSGLRLTGPDKAEIPTSGAMLMDDDTLYMVSLPAGLKPGVYKVEWHALAKDGHKTQGSYNFTVKP
jgi:copper resistance protein C